MYCSFKMNTEFVLEFIPAKLQAVQARKLTQKPVLLSTQLNCTLNPQKELTMDKCSTASFNCSFSAFIVTGH